MAAIFLSLDHIHTIQRPSIVIIYCCVSEVVTLSTCSEKNKACKKNGSNFFTLHTKQCEAWPKCAIMFISMRKNGLRPAGLLLQGVG